MEEVILTLKSMRIPANGTVLHVEEHSSKGEALVFLPYQSGQTVMWSDLIPQFTDHYRVIALDMRGFGQSDQPESGYDLNTMAEDLRGVLDALGIERAHFIGNSLGGYASTNFASKYPERALSLVNIESAMLTDTSPGTRFAGMTREEAEAWTLAHPLPDFASRDAYIQHCRENFKPWNSLIERAVEATVLRELDNGRVAGKQTEEIRLSIQNDLYGRDWNEFYQHIQCPVLFMPCDEEQATLPQKLANIERYSVNLPFTKTVVLPNSGHLMPFLQSDEVAAEVLKFFEEIR
jgi:2-succinyl-6-hydroxy-2,4-cyclohexadiene-1-carboxylate synthase